jgi:hypothetical protein
MSAAPPQGGLTPALGVMSNISATWRKILDAQAFDHAVWEFKSRQLAASSLLLHRATPSSSETPKFDSISAIPSAQLLLALAIELMAKALYLKQAAGPREAIYSHDVLQLVGSSLSPEQAELLEFSQTFVVWAGRYPTPKWTSEKYKISADVPSHFVDGMEHFNALDFPSHASHDRYLELGGLFNHLRSCWEAA